MIFKRLLAQSIAIAAAVVLCDCLGVAAAESSGRKTVVARHEISADLAAAMADGLLTSKERCAIIRKAKQSLSEQEIQGLRRTLERLAGPDQGSTTGGQDLPDTLTPSEGRVLQAAEGAEAPESGRPVSAASYQQASEGADPASDPGYDTEPTVMPEESPFQEEDALDDECFQTCRQGTCRAGRNWLGFDRRAYFEGWRHIRLSSCVEAFKGPMDLDNRNGNFGVSFAANGGFPLAERFGLGLQVGTSAVLSDFHGTEFTGSDIRRQNFTTVGLFQRITTARGTDFKWGFAFDWLFDRYYTRFQMSQWRVQLAYELDACREIGIWSCIPNCGDNALVGPRGEQYWIDHFKPMPQGNLYYRRCWRNDASTTAYIGIAEEPGEVIFGGRARLPLSCRLSMIGNFHYVLPSADGAGGQDEEMWNVAVGIEFIPGWGGNRCRDHRFTPLMPLADNGIFSVRRY